MVSDSEVNIDVLFEKPEPATKGSLFIEPLAPLSLVTSMPGAYYRSQREPSEFMIYGMLENLLGWHFTDAERNPIIKALKKHYKKAYKTDKELANIDFDKSGVGFKSLLQHHLKIEKLLLKPHIESFEDYWTQHLKHNDIRHLDGSRNYDSSIEFDVDNLSRIRQEYKSLKSSAKKIKDKMMKEDNKLVQVKLKEEISEEEKIIMKNNYQQMPNYYSSPKVREYIIVKGSFGYCISGNNSILDILTNAVNNLETPLYLGTNEGWVDIKIEKI